MQVSRGRCLLPDLIEAKGWTQAEYARRSGRSKRMISYFCQNKRVMQPEDVYTACLLFGVGIEKTYEWIINEQAAD